MKSTEHFKNTILAYLEKRAEEDKFFATSCYKKEGKNIDDCCTYILNEVQKSGCNGFADEEIYSMAVHYYDEDNIKVGEPINHGSVVVNHTVELTEQEKAAARQQAIEQFQAKVIADIQKKKSAAKSKENAIVTPSLFD
jgi:6-phosphogluconate dehydrogenase (decarboxylating)